MEFIIEKGKQLRTEREVDGASGTLDQSEGRKQKKRGRGKDKKDCLADDT